MKESKGYTWSGHAHVLSANGFFYLCRWNSDHSCGVAVCMSQHPRVESKLVSDIVSSRVHHRPLTRPTDVILDLKDDYGLNVTHHVTWLGIEKEKSELFGTHYLSFDQLSWYNNAVTEYNSGSYTNLDYDQHTYRFTRYFISFKAYIDRFTHCCPLLFLDATFLKDRGRRYGEMSSNATEFFNSWIHDARNLPITKMVDNIRIQLMRQMAKRRATSQTWTEAICPKIESRLEKVFNKDRSWKLSQSNNEIYEVQSYPSVLVDIGRRTCSGFQ
ncbi:hypothetical protein ACSBR2_014664 [Camellia fascicularis]